MRQVRESVEIGRPVEQVAALWNRAAQPGDEASFEDLGGRTRLTVVRSAPDEGFVEHMVDVAFNAEGRDLKGELEQFRIDCEGAL